MRIQTLIVKDIIFHPSERKKAGAHVQRLLNNGWDEFSGWVDEKGLAQGQTFTDGNDGMELIQVHKRVIKTNAKGQAST